LREVLDCFAVWEAMTSMGKNEWSAFLKNFNESNSQFIRNLSQTYPQLSPAEFRVCCYLRAGFSNGEICEALDLRQRTVEATRYRLRKKLPIQSHEDLTIFLMKI